MCRNIRTLFNFEPPASDDEIHAAALQFVRKVSGSNKPSLANVAAFERAVAESFRFDAPPVAFAANHGPGTRPRDRGGEGPRSRPREVCVKLND